jgi:hypothetical protein
VDAAVVELDSLPDPVRTGAEDDDALLPPLGIGRRFVDLAPGREVVVRRGLDLARAGIYAAETRPELELEPLGAKLGLLATRGLGDLGIRKADALQAQ